jgi:hypothetical protein
MWLITNFGFYSIVQKPGESALTVRSRVEEDLVRLRLGYLPTLGPIVDDEGTDYGYRARVSHDDLAAAMPAIVRDITYPNFKDAVKKCQGRDRAAVYTRVWDALWELQEGSRFLKLRGGP